MRVSSCWRGALRLAQRNVPYWRCVTNARVEMVNQKNDRMDGFTQLVYVEAIVVYKMSTAVLSSRSLQLWITGQCALELLALARVQPCGGPLVDRHATTTCTMLIAVTDSIVIIAFSPQFVQTRFVRCRL